MKSKILKLISLALALTMVFTLCACSKGGESGKDGKKGEKVKIEHVYSVDYLDADLPDGFSVSNIFYNAEKLYLYGYYNREIKGETEEETIYEYGNALYSVDMNSKQLSLLFEMPEISKYDDQAMTSDYEYINNMLVGKDGAIWAVKTISHDDWSDENNYISESKTMLVNLSETGEEISSIDLSQVSTQEYFYVNAIVMDGDGDIVFNDDTNIYIMDTAGNLKGKIATSSNSQSYAYIYYMTTLGTGEVIASMNEYNDQTGESKSSIVKVDKNAKKLEEIGDVPSNLGGYGMIGAVDSSLYFNASGSVYAYDLNTKESTEKLNWINSDINYSRIGNITLLPDGRMVTMEYDRNWSKANVMFLSPKPEDEITEKYLLTYASIYPDDTISEAIIQFNKRSDEYRIQMVDYSKYNTEEDWEAGYKQLNNDIVSGNIPDIISMNGLPYNNYVSKGILADLTKLMSENTTFNKDEYLENILNATAVDGKIYSIIPYFDVTTVVGKTENVGSEMGWTIADLKALMQKYPDAAPFSEMSRSDVLVQFSRLALDDFINFATGECKFTQQGFKELLEFINTFPEEIDWESIYGEGDWWELYESQYRENRTLLSVQGLYGYDVVRDIVNNFGEDFTFVGFPMNDGIGSAINPMLEVSISSKSNHQDACWDFVKYLLSEEYQKQITWDFPIRKDCLDELKKDAMTADDYEEGGVEIYPDSDIATPYYYDYSKPLTQELVDKVDNLLNAVSSVARDNTEIMDIIQEEAGAYFAGQKSAEAVAEIIQSRVQIFVNESR